MLNGKPNEQQPIKPTRLGILMSDSCEHCMAIATAARSGSLPDCEVAVVVSNVTGAAGIETARTAGLPVVVMEGCGREQRDHESAISTLLRTYRVDLVCIASYLRMLSPGFIREWRGRILAIHPYAEEALAYPEAIQFMLSGEYQVQGRRLLPRPTPEKPDENTSPDSGHKLDDSKARHAEQQPPLHAAEFSEPVASA